MNNLAIRRLWRWGLFLGLSGAALGCGEVGGGGQCFGVDVSGMCVAVESIIPTDTAVSNKDTSSVDAYQTIDCDPATPQFEVEPIGPHSSKVTFSAQLMPGLTSPPAPAFVTWTGYTIEYIPNPNNLVFSPPLTGWSLGETIKVDINTTLERTLELVPVQTKAEYGELGGSPLPTNYTAVFTFFGTTQFNQDLVVKGTTNFDIGDWDNCE